MKKIIAIRKSSMIALLIASGVAAQAQAKNKTTFYERGSFTF